MRFSLSNLVLLFSLLLCPLALVSCETLLDVLYQLINQSDDAKNNAYRSISEQYEQVLLETDEELYGNIIPTLTETYNNIHEYIKEMESQTVSLGYNFTSCVTFVEETLVESSLLNMMNITTRATEEKRFIYDKIIHDTLSIGQSKLNLIDKEISTITNEYYICSRSVYPEYCNGSLYNKVLEKQKLVPSMYEKVIEITNLNLLQQGTIYGNFIQDYVQEVTRSMKPYISFLESCLQRLVATNDVSKIPK